MEEGATSLRMMCENGTCPKFLAKRPHRFSSEEIHYCDCCKQKLVRYKSRLESRRILKAQKELQELGL